MMDKVIELSDSSDDTEIFHHDLSDRDEWVAEGYSGGDSEASEDEEGEIAEDQLINDSQGEEDVPDGAESSDDQDSGATGGLDLRACGALNPARHDDPLDLRQHIPSRMISATRATATNATSLESTRGVAVRRSHGITHRKKTTSSRGPGEILKAVTRGTVITVSSAALQKV
nr:uncharacterized protein LOC118879112 [Drosophila suzukii]